MATSLNLGNSIDYLVDIGVFDVLLPFLLIFSIVFAILEKTQIFGQGKTNINVIVSTVVGLLIVVQTELVELLNLFLPRVAMIMVVVLMGLLLIAMLAGKEFSGLKGNVLGVAVIFIIIAIIYALTASPSPFGGLGLTSQDKEAIIAIGVPLVILLIVIGVVTKNPDKPKTESFLEKLAKEFGGK
ncbi:hypothetical protein J4216_03685 [Candidatus Woesearchaeota archaeon]|nr:hypothetical protein [Candidatus Woesearchaeota archaeon]